MKNLKSLLALLLLGCMVFALCACGTNTDADDTTEADTTVEDTTVEDTTTAPAAFQVKVVDGDGNVVPGTMVQVCKDFCVFAATNDSGIASFSVNVDSDGYKLSVLQCPDGYEYTGEAEIYLESGISEYVLEITKVN